MKPLIPVKGATPLFFIALALLYFAVLPQAQAVIPPPDGGYPGFNTAEGQNSLLSLTTGSANTAVGWLSLRTLTAGSFNTAIGAGTLLSNTGDANTATGAAALLFNTTGERNTATGTATLLNNTTGFNNTANGYQALQNNITGAFNTANGSAALSSNTTADYNTASGFQALSSNTTGTSNTANGVQALSSNTTGIANTANGVNALLFNTTGNNNTAFGVGAGSNVITANDVICIGAGTSGLDVSNTCFIAGIRGVTTSIADAIPVMIDSGGQLGTASSSRRFKHEIKSMDSASEAILALKPVTFHYKGDKTGAPQFGLIAEEVAEVNPDLVVRDKNGEIYTVRYDAVNAMLLNEFLKEHRKNEEQEATVAELKSILEKQEATNARQQKQIAALAVGLQKVNAQLKVTKLPPQFVNNDY